MKSLWRVGRRLLGLGLVTSLLGAALGAQGVPAGRAAQVTLELGFGGEIVAGRWNPLRLTVRDTPPAELVVSFDQSSFTEPETLGLYRLQIPGSGGVAVFEDDVFVPEWRQLVWRLVSDDTVLASGSLGRALRDARPLTLLLSARPARWQNVLDDARVVVLPAGLLPERLAAFDGVSTLLIDGSAPAPHLAAVAAATSAGVQTLLVEALPRSHEELRALSAEQPLRLGAGWLARLSDPEASLPTLDRVDFSSVTTALLNSDMHPPPPAPAQLPLALVAGGYAVLVLLLLRFAGTPGLVTGLAVAALSGVSAWLYLRPATEQTVLSRSVVTSGGALARRDEVRSVFSLPRTTAQVAGAARPTGALPYTQTRSARAEFRPSAPGEQFEVALARWGAADLALRPQLVEAALRWQEGTLHNSSGVLLGDLFVVGLGAQPDLAAGASWTPRAAEERSLPSVYHALADALPTGTALARSGGTLYLAPPPYAHLAGGSDARAGR